MKEIKITQSNSKKIEEALRKINLRSTAHTYTNFNDIENLTIDAESRLTNLIGAKKNFAGAIFYAASGFAVGNSYKYSRDATSVTLTRKSSDWYLTAVVSTIVYKEGGKKCLRLTEDQDVIAYEKLRTNYILQSLSA